MKISLFESWKPHLLAVFAELSKENLPDWLLVDDVVIRVGLQGRRQIDALRHVGERQKLLPFFAATREINVWEIVTRVLWKLSKEEGKGGGGGVGGGTMPS